MTRNNKGQYACFCRDQMGESPMPQNLSGIYQVRRVLRSWRKFSSFFALTIRFNAALAEGTIPQTVALRGASQNRSTSRASIEACA